MNARTRWIIALAGAIAAALCMGSMAEAQQRVVIESFSGPRGSRMRASVMANLQEGGDVEIVSPQQVDRAARRIGIRRRSLLQGDYPRVAEELDITAFVSGRVHRRRRSWVLTVTVRNGADGDVLGAESWSGRTVGSLGSVRRTAYSRLSPYLDAAGRGGGRSRPVRGSSTRDRDRDRDDGGRRDREIDTRDRDDGRRDQRDRGRDSRDPDDDADDPPSRPWWQQSADEERGGPGRDDDADDHDDYDDDDDGDDGDGDDGDGDDGDDDDGDDDDGDDDDGDDDSVGASRWLDLSLLVGSLSRSMQANVLVQNNGRDPDQDANAIIPEQRKYDSGGAIGHMEAGIAAEFYPGALLDKPAATWLGLRGSYRNSLFLTSFGCRQRTPPTAPCTPVDQMEVQTRQSELYIGGRVRYPIGEGDEGLLVLGDVGFGNFRFILEPGHLAALERPSVIPPLSYSYVHLGAGGSYGVVPVYLRLGVEAAYNLGLGVGRDAQAVWGTQTTQVSGFSVGLTAKSEAPYVAEGVYLGVNLEYFRFTTVYAGQTACAFQGCTAEEPWEQWPADENGNLLGGIQGPVDDNYLRIGVAFGYSMR